MVLFHFRCHLLLSVATCDEFICLLSFAILQTIKSEPLKNSENQLIELRSYLLALGKTESQLKQLHENVIDGPTPSDTEHSIIEVLELWQKLFQDTFQQYHRLSSRLVQSKDGASALKLWRDYLQHVQTFLSSQLPEDYSSLTENRHLCEVHQNLLTSQQSVLKLKTDATTNVGDAALTEQFISLTNLHNETLSRIVDRHTEIEVRLSAWDKYRNDQTQLLEWLKEKEKEKTQLQLRYIHLRRVPHIMNRIETLIEQIPIAEIDAENLRKQQAYLLRFCNDAHATSIRMEHAAIAQRILNLRAALETWKDFLARIINLGRTYDGKVKELQSYFGDVQQLINVTSNNLPNSRADIEAKLNLLRGERVRLNNVMPDLEQISVIQEELKECISPNDMKTIRQMVWILWQQQAELDIQLSTLINQIEERLSLNALFLAKCERLMQWMDTVEKRMDNESHSRLCDPEDLIRRLEKELDAEINLREREKEWLIVNGQELLTIFASNSTRDKQQRAEIQIKLNLIADRWERLRYLCKSQSKKIHDLKLTIERLEERIARIRAWLYTMEVHLSEPLTFASAAEDSFKKTSQEHDAHQREIEKQSSNVGEVLNLCDMLLSDVDTWKAQFNTDTLSLAVQNLDRRWKNVCSLSAERKRRIHSTWELLQEVLITTNAQSKWITEHEKDLDKLSAGLQKLTPQQSQERIQILENKIREVEERSPVFKDLYQSYSKLNKSNHLDSAKFKELTAPTKDVLVRYSALSTKALNILGKLNMDVKVYREFINTHGKAIVALTQIDAELTKTQHLTAPSKPDDPQRQLDSIHVLEQELKLCEADLTNADELGLAIMKKSKPDEITAIQTLIDEYQMLWKDITTRLTILRTELTTKVQKQKEINESVQVETLRFETESAVQVNTLPGLNRTTSITAKDAYIFELETAIEETRANLDELEKTVNDPSKRPGSQVVSKAISVTQSSIELVNHLSTILITECFCTDEEAQVVRVAELSARYETLVSLWKARERQQAENRYANIFCYFSICFHSSLFSSSPMNFDLFIGLIEFIYILNI